MSKNIIETSNLTKIFKLKGKKQEIVALNNINISVKEREIFGLLGPNGAGKTTLIQILSTLIQPTKGYATIDGINVIQKPKQAKEKISLMLGQMMLYNRLTGHSNLKFFCKIYNVPNYNEKIYEITKEFGLKEWLNQYTGSYSNGMRIKLALCRTLLLNRKILILDEPTLGLDLQTKAFLIEKLKNLNKTILITSHDMSVVEKLCDRVAFINRGNILKIGTKEDINILEEKEIKIEVKIYENKKVLNDQLTTLSFVKNIIETNTGLIISLKNRDNYKSLIQLLGSYEVQKITEHDFSIEDLFFKLLN